MAAETWRTLGPWRPQFCAAVGELVEPWSEKHAAAREAHKAQRFFEAVQLINAALVTFQERLDEEGAEALLTEPLAFARGQGQALDSHRKAELCDLWSTRADILMNLGGIRRAMNELDAALLLVSDVPRASELRAECNALLVAQDEGASSQQQLTNQKKVPAHILTGFLGSGKTTLLNHILSDLHGRKIAVIENEFGEIGIDDALIARREELGEQQIIVMNNGCICCTVRGDLIKGLRSILQRAVDSGDRLDGVIIETTGLADPAPVAQTFFADDYVQTRMLLDGIITVVDAKHIVQHLRDEKPEGVQNEAVEQLAFADRILLNKVDLVAPAYLSEVEAEIRRINAFAPITRTEHSRIPVEDIVGIRCFSLDRVLQAAAGFLDEDNEHEHDVRVTSVGLEREGECHLDRLNAWLGHLLKERGADIFRMKGILALQGSNQRYAFQGIHMIFGGQPMGEWPAGEVKSNKMIFIGRNLDRAELVRGFEATLVTAAETSPAPVCTMPHAGFVLESGVIPGTLEQVWSQQILPMNFKFWKVVTISSRVAEDDSPLGQYTLAFSDHTIQTVRVTEISARLPNKRSIGMEFVSSDPRLAYTSRMDTIVLSQVTHSVGGPHVFVEYSSDFSSDAPSEALEDSKFKKRDFLDDLAAFNAPK